MTGPINPVSQTNFLPGNLPPNTEGFYNSKAFAANEINFLSTQVSMEEQAQKRGLDQIKDAIDGLI
jgi:hypothetical protein